MFTGSFTFGRERLHRMRDAFEPRKPRHPLMRIATGLLGLGILGVLIFVSVFVGAAMILGGVAYRLWRNSGRPHAANAANARIVDGEYRVLSRPVLRQSR